MSLGQWVHLATFERHNGNTDEAGNPTYTNEADWTPVLERWPCGRSSTGGRMTSRGRQQIGEETFTLNGDPRALVERDIDIDCRVRMAWGVVFEIESISGTDALSTEATVELGKQIRFDQ